MKRLQNLFLALLSCISCASFGDIILRFEARNDAEKTILHRWLMTDKGFVKDILFALDNPVVERWAYLVDILPERTKDPIVGINHDIIIPNPSIKYTDKIESIVIHRRGYEKLFFPVKDNHTYTVRLAPCKSHENTVPIFTDIALEDQARKSFFCVEEFDREQLIRRAAEFKKFSEVQEEFAILPPELNGIFKEYIVGPDPKPAAKIANEDSDARRIVLFFNAVRAGDVSRVKNTVTSSVVNERAINGLTPLMEAAARGHAQIVDILLSHGARLDMTDAQGNSVVKWAVAGEQYSLAQMLLQAMREKSIAVADLKELLDMVLKDASKHAGDAAYEEFLQHIKKYSGQSAGRKNRCSSAAE